MHRLEQSFSASCGTVWPVVLQIWLWLIQCPVLVRRRFTGMRWNAERKNEMLKYWHVSCVDLEASLYETCHKSIPHYKGIRKWTGVLKKMHDQSWTEKAKRQHCWLSVSWLCPLYDQWSVWSWCCVDRGGKRSPQVFHLTSLPYLWLCLSLSSLCKL